MNIPEFTAEASLYKTSRHYRSSVADVGSLIADQSVVAAYYPGPSTQKGCDKCLQNCADDQSSCEDFALAASFFVPWGPAVYPICDDDAARCRRDCINPPFGACCPKACGPRNPYDPREGCCDRNDQCVDQNDPNSRHGCCPSDQRVCGGKCCAKGDSCCGDTCCPAGFFCRDGWICEPQFIGSFGVTPPKPRGRTPYVGLIAEWCRHGETPCGATCCLPGLECCYNVPPYTGVCRTSCGPR
jgi:hypothetical protein